MLQVTISKIYQDQQAKTQFDLEKRIENQARKLTDYQKNLSTFKEKNTNLMDSLAKKKMQLDSINEEYDFLLKRIEKIHGKKVVYDLLNCFDNPNPLAALIYKDKHFSKEVL